MSSTVDSLAQPEKVISTANKPACSRYRYVVPLTNCRTYVPFTKPGSELSQRVLLVEPTDNVAVSELGTATREPAHVHKLPQH